MTVDVTVLRVFTNSAGDFGNPLGVVDASSVPSTQWQRIATELNYSETIFVDIPAENSHSATLRIFTPATELPFAGHPTVGASWWLRSVGRPVNTLQVPAGVVAVEYNGDLTSVRARADWAPDFAFYELDSADDVLNANPDDYSDSVEHCIWAWTDKESGGVRSRVFASVLGVPEDEATGAAAVRLTDVLSRDLTIAQGKGSLLHTTWHADGWVNVAGRVVADDHVTVD